MSLFTRGSYILASGQISNFKIDADFLEDEDIETIAWMFAGNIPLDFGSVEGIPRGGLRLAEAMRKYQQPNKTDRILLVDDVWTTGGSMRNYRNANCIGKDVIGAVIFARRMPDLWVLPLLRLWSPR